MEKCREIIKKRANPRETESSEIASLAAKTKDKIRLLFIVNINEHKARALVDTGAAGNYISKSFANKYNILVVQKKTLY